MVILRSATVRQAVTFLRSLASRSSQSEMPILVFCAQPAVFAAGVSQYRQCCGRVHKLTVYFHLFYSHFLLPGYNADGQLADGTTNHKYSPPAGDNIPGVLSVHRGYWHNCVILNINRAVRCWGECVPIVSWLANMM